MSIRNTVLNMLENEIENILNQTFSSVQNTPHPFPNNQTTQNYPTNQTSYTNPHIENNDEIDLLRQQTIDDLLRYYNKNMRDYQKNISEMVRLLQPREPATEQEIEYTPRRTRFSPVDVFQYTYNTAPNNRPTNNRPTNNPPTNNLPTRPLLSQYQINNAIETINYNDTLNENRCPITLDDFVIGESIYKIRHCSHIFKKQGLMNWFSRNSHCPVCRYNLQDYNMDLSEQNYPTGPSGPYSQTYLSSQNQSSGSTGPYSQTYLSSQNQSSGSTGPYSQTYISSQNQSSGSTGPYSQTYLSRQNNPVDPTNTSTSSSRNNIFSYFQNILTQSNNTDSSNNNILLFEFYDISNNSMYDMD